MVVSPAILPAQISSALVALVAGIVCCLLFTVVWKTCLGTPNGFSFAQGLLFFSIMVGAGAALRVTALVLSEALKATGSFVFVVHQMLWIVQVFALLAFLVWSKQAADAMV